jgi:PAS domain S-box/diguanylate cyclase (GGDEF) domain
MYCEFLKTIPDAALLADDEGGIVWGNEMAVALFGGSANVLWAQNIEEVIPELSRQAHDQHMQRYWDDPVTRPLDNRDRLAALRQDRTWISVAIMLNQVDLLDGRYVVAMCRDMSREQRQQNDLHEALGQEKALSSTDSVTGAGNRRHFRNELLYEIERSSRHARVFTIAYFDLDNFKDVNDRYGHAQGDKVLQQIVKVAQSRLRKTDVVARIGGDEFAILLPETDTTTMQSPITDLLHEMKQSMHDSGWPVTISCGVVTFRTPPGNPEDALKAADKLMYEVKAAGKDASREVVFERGPSELRHSSGTEGELPD